MPHAAAVLPLAALLDVQAETEASVVAVVSKGAWQAPSVAGKEVVARVAKRGGAFRIFPAGANASAPAASGTLSGTLRENCGEFYPGLTAPATGQGFAAIDGATPPIAAVPLVKTAVDVQATAAVAAVIAEATKLKVSPKVQNAYRVDLDGDGKPETIVEATHPDLLGDPPKYKRQYYSVLVVIPGGAGAPVFTGYLQAARQLSQFEVVAVDSVADVDRDGKLEMLVRARHAEGWQTQVFRYDGRALTELFRSVNGEGECAGGGGE